MWELLEKLLVEVDKSVFKHYYDPYEYTWKVEIIARKLTIEQLLKLLRHYYIMKGRDEVYVLEMSDGISYEGDDMYVFYTFQRTVEDEGLEMDYAFIEKYYTVITKDGKIKQGGFLFAIGKKKKNIIITKKLITPEIEKLLEKLGEMGIEIEKYEEEESSLEDEACQGGVCPL